MAEFYLDFGGDFFADSSGQGTQQLPYNGAAALVQLINGSGGLSALDAGDSVFVRGECDLSELNFVYLSDITGWQTGDILSDNADYTQSTFRARIFHIGSDSCVHIACDPPTEAALPTFGQSLYNNSRSTSGTYLGSQDVSVAFNNNSGSSSGGFIKIIGCNQSWQTDGSRAVIDGDYAARHCVDLYSSKLWFENIHFTRAWYHNVNAQTDSIEHVFINCESSYSALNAMGMYLAVSYDTVLHNCNIHDNGHYGIYFARGVVNCCSFTNNAKTALRGKYSQTITNCVFADNGGESDSGLILDRDGGFVSSCVIHSSGLHGIEITSGYSQQFIFGNRITNNGGYGICGQIGTTGNHNVFYANALGSIDGFDLGGEDIEAASDGYIDAASGDFALEDAAPARRIAIDVNTLNKAYLTAGLTAADISHDQQVSFINHEIEFI